MDATKALKRHHKFQLNPEHVRTWGEMFWCPAFCQWTCLAQCNFRWTLAKEHACYESCKKCAIRRHSFRALRKPRIIVRTPRVK